jgi:gamma-glutamyltranspeptidase/glutathione hydrolase
LHAERCSFDEDIGMRLATIVLAALSAAGPLPNAMAQLPQQRPDAVGLEAAVTSDHGLASSAGADVLRRGGNAVDAAITMAGVLAVVRPHMNGVGGDNFLLIREGKTGRIVGLNGSGRAGSKAAPALLRERGLSAMPAQGIMTVSVPGAVQSWADALQRYGTISLAQALAPAIHYAEQGFPVSARLALDIAAEQKLVAQDPELARIFLPNGAPPVVGTLLKQPDLARTLRAIAAGGPAALYKGLLAKTIASFIEREGGLVTEADLAKHTSSWQEPITTTFHGRTVVAFPPNTQGMTLLEQLNVAELMDLKAMGHNSAQYIHTLTESAKLAFADRDRYLADPAFAEVPVAKLLSKEYAKELAVRLRERLKADEGRDANGKDGTGDTVYLAVVDKDGNAVSMIQSLFAAFGSGRMVPGTGITLHNRGALFSLDAAHPNILAPGKRPFHTLCPAMMLNADKSLHLVFGTPGGDGQTQTLVQVLQNIELFGMTPQQAVEAPRWRWYSTGTKKLAVEPGVAPEVRDALTRLGHKVAVQEPSEEFGGAQAILILANGGRMVGADPRREAYAIAY